MERNIHDLQQNTGPWHQFRLAHHGASEAAAMLGISKHVTRSELLKAKHTSIAQEFSDWLQRNVLDKGHEVEAKARTLIEALLGEDFYPSTYSFGVLSASTDGINVGGTIAFEHKQWNESLADSVGRQELPDEYMPQCQQVLLVTGAEKLIFVVSDGTPNNMVYMWVHPSPEWQARIVAGWKQFEVDLAAYELAAPVQEVLPEPTKDLPALSIRVDGALSLISNLDIFGQQLRTFIDGVDKAPSDDEGFANAEAAIKTLQKAQDALEQAESSALAQTVSIDEMRRTVKLYADQARTTRLMLQKMVTARKDSIRIEIVQAGKAAMAKHMAALNTRLGQPLMPLVPADFGGVIKGKRTIASLKDAVASELARAKIAANEVADRIQLNVNCFADKGAEHRHLFADLAQLVLKDTEAFQHIVVGRVAEHKRSEELRLERERERIRKEEQAKAEQAARQLLEQQARDARLAEEVAERKAKEQRDEQERLARIALEAEERKAAEARAEADAKQRQLDAQARKALEAEAVKLREQQRQTNELVDGRELLNIFLERFGHRKEFTPVAAAIRMFLEAVDKVAA